MSWWISGKRGATFTTSAQDVDPAVQSFIQTALESTPDVLPTLEQAGDVSMRVGQYRGMLLRKVVAQKGGMRYLNYIATWDKCSRECEKQ